jgi:hypothetical protein
MPTAQAVERQAAEPLVPTFVPTSFAWKGNQASELEPRYGIEP